VVSASRQHITTNNHINATIIRYSQDPSLFKKLFSAFAVAAGDHNHDSTCVSCPSAGTGCGGACSLDD
jgi:hypothetical protein